MEATNSLDELQEVELSALDDLLLLVDNDFVNLLLHTWVSLLFAPVYLAVHNVVVFILIREPSKGIEQGVLKSSFMLTKH